MLIVGSGFAGLAAAIEAKSAGSPVIVIEKMPVDRKQIVEELGSIQEPRLIQEGDFLSDSIMRVISSQGGYRLEVDAFPIDGPFEFSV